MIKNIFNDYIQERIIDLIKEGRRNYEACALLGLPTGTLRNWVSRGKRESEGKYHTFFLRYEDAKGKGRHALLARKRQRREDYMAEREIYNPYVPLPDLLFTEEKCKLVLDNIAAGAFPTVAAEAAGVPAVVLSCWIERGKQAPPENQYTQFYLAYITQIAQARMAAEKIVYQDMPLAWLMNGPGKHRPDAPGWGRQQEQAQGGNVQVIVTSWGTTVESTP